MTRPTRFHCALAAAALSLLASPLALAAQDTVQDDASDEWDVVDSSDGEVTLIRAASLAGPEDARAFEAEHRYDDGTADRAVLIANCPAKTFALKHMDELENGKVVKSFDATPEQAKPRSAEGKASTEGMLSYVCAN